MAKLRIGYFLEDIAQEGFIRAIVNRIAIEVGIQLSAVEHDIRFSSGGGGKAIHEFRRFLRLYGKAKSTPFDLLIVAIDGNCKGFNEVANRLKEYGKQYNYPAVDHIICAIPDPHIERWYLIDLHAFKEATGLVSEPNIPRYKCKKGIYKQAVEENLRSAGISSLLGGSEYAETIVNSMQNLYHLGKEDHSFGSFIESLDAYLRRLVKV